MTLTYFTAQVSIKDLHGSLVLLSFSCASVQILFVLLVGMFVIVALPKYFQFYYRAQTWFFMHLHSPGPEGGVENRGRRPRFSTSPKGPGEC